MPLGEDLIGADEEKPQKPAETMDDRVYSVLIVGDEGSIQAPVRKILESSKRFRSNMDAVENGEAAMDKMEKEEIDLVLAGYDLPGSDGIMFLIEVKKVYPDVVRILIADEASEEAVKEAYRNTEINNYILKPWDDSEVRLVVHAALKRKYEREAVEKQEFMNVTDALRTVLDFQKELLDVSADRVINKKPKLMFEFTSPREFNKFSFEIKKMDNADIEDVYIFEDKYIVTVVAYPQSFQRVM